MLKPATDLVTDRPTVVNERPMVVPHVWCEICFISETEPKSGQIAHTHGHE